MKAAQGYGSCVSRFKEGRIATTVHIWHSGHGSDLFLQPGGYNNKEHVLIKMLYYILHAINCKNYYF
jgi:hypothetical protein